MHLISHKYKVIFIHIGKNAGGSIIDKAGGVLHEYMGDNDERLTLFVDIQKWRERYKAEFKEYFKFCFVRNPWDRLVSGYFYLQPRLKKIPQVKKFSSFESFVLGFHRVPEIMRHHVFMPQHSSVAEDGVLFVDYVGRFEDLERDFGTVCERIGLPQPLRLTHIRKSGYGGAPHKNYRHYYSKEMVRTVAEVFEEDIRMFGYTFDWGKLDSVEGKRVKFSYEGHLIEFTFTDDQDHFAKYISKNETFFEEHFLRCLKDNKIVNPGDVGLDIWACICNHTIYFSKIIGVRKVISIEPTLRSFEVMQENIKLNNINNVICRRVAISSGKGLAKCFVKKPNNIGSNRWVPVGENAIPLIGPDGIAYNADMTKDDVYVETVSLTDIVNEKIDFIKMDVEDAENMIIEAGKDVMREHRPGLMVEVSRLNLERFECLMKELDYVQTGESVFAKNRTKKTSTVLYKHREK